MLAHAFACVLALAFDMTHDALTRFVILGNALAIAAVSFIVFGG